MNKYEQLEKLQELKEKGILSEKEYELEKMKLLSDQNQHQKKYAAHQTPLSNQKKSNGAATAGLVLSLIGLLIIPFLFGALGLIFSGVGLSKSPDEYSGKGNAIAGLVIGVVDLIWGFFWFALFVSN